MKVTIIGRENVGKSTLFNTLISERKSLTSDIPGTTRDTKYSMANWRGASFTLVDTAGLNISEQTIIGVEIKKRLNKALNEADIILFVVDGQIGVVSQDREIAKIIRTQNKPFVLVVNKIDSKKKSEKVNDFIRLGLGDPFVVSAKNGIGTGDLLDKVFELLDVKEDNTYNTDNSIKISLIGQPNVGKSSLLNAILGEDKVIVTQIPNTTREPNDIPFKYKENNLVLIDTAGLRRRRQTHNLDALSMLKSTQTIKQSDVVLLVLDCSIDMNVQDQRLAGMIRDENKACVVIINKWDLIEDKKTNTINEFQERIQNELPFLKGAPFLFVSSTQKVRVDKILDVALLAWQESHREITSKELERFLKRIVKIQKPRQARGVKKPRIYELKQTGSNPPWFTVRIGRHDTLHASYMRFIENQLREQYGFIGAPIKIVTYKLKHDEQKKIAQAPKQKNKRRIPIISRR